MVAANLSAAIAPIRADGAGYCRRVTWTKLGERREDRLWRGAVLRCVGVYPHEGLVDFMLVDVPHVGAFGLLVTTGSKAGLLLAVVPDEARLPDCPGAVSASWLLANWTERIYDTDPDTVMVSDGYPAPDIA